MVEELNQIPVSRFELDPILRILLLQTPFPGQWVIEPEFDLRAFPFLRPSI